MIPLTKYSADDRKFLDDCRRVIGAGLPKADLLMLLEAIGSEDKVSALNQVLAERWHPLTRRFAETALDLIGGGQ